MEAVLVGEAWYRLVATGSLYESEFEALLKQHAGTLFPGYRAVDFKATVQADLASHRPDFALIDHRYRDWWVVEVERVDHDLYGHVIPQVNCFRTGTYTEDHAVALTNADSQLDNDRLEEMLKGDPPGVLVVADRFLAEWDASIRANGGWLLGVPVYRAETNHLAFGMIGRLPERSSEMVTRCRRDRLMRAFLQVASPAALPIAAGEKCDIVFRNGITRWHRLDTKGQIFLAPVGANPLPEDGEEYVLRKVGADLLLESE